MPSKSIELHFPTAGVNRRLSLRNAAGKREKYFAPWSVNCRVDDNIDRRLRGGSRPGLTLFVDDDFGTTIADMVSVNVSSSAGGASEVLFVMVDSGIKTVEGGTTTTQSGVAPSSGFLVTGQQHVFAVSSGITKMNPKTGSAETLVASAGTIPTSCTFGAVYRDRFLSFRRRQRHLHEPAGGLHELGLREGCPRTRGGHCRSSWPWQRTLDLHRRR